MRDIADFYTTPHKSGRPGYYVFMLDVCVSFCLSVCISFPDHNLVNINGFWPNLVGALKL